MDVQASWIQPTVRCPRSGVYATFFWTGIDGGDEANRVEQTGTAGECINGTPAYLAWTEMWPAYASVLPDPVGAGDLVHAEVRVTGFSHERGCLPPGLLRAEDVPSSTWGYYCESHVTDFAITISDSTRHWSVTRTYSSSSVPLSTAEWVVESPEIHHFCSENATGYCLLAPFDPVRFTGATARRGGPPQQYTAFSPTTWALANSDTTGASERPISLPRAPYLWPTVHYVGP